MGLLRFAIKSSILGGITYYTIEEGLWSSPEESAKFYGKIYNSIAPTIKENIPSDIVNDIPTVPSSTEMKKYLAIKWNCGVKVSIKYLSELPLHMANGYDIVKKQIEKSTEATLASSDQK